MEERRDFDPMAVLNKILAGPSQEAAFQDMARTTRQVYQAYVDEGFTPDQAMTLTTTIISANIK